MSDVSEVSRRANSAEQPYDLFIIGGGVNGCGIARDAAGRGLSVGLAEMNDIASATSSSSTKLFHGGLRYLEYFEFRLVRGSHIVTRKLYEHEKCYFFQGEDGRIIFTIPYENEFTLIGTTDVDHPDLAAPPVCSDEETDYLLAFASSYLETPVERDDIVASFSGVRPLYNDGAGSASAATRDYVLRLDDEGGLPLLNIFGGKITTYRKLAESVMKEIRPFFGSMSGSWTAIAPLPGGDFAVDGFEQLVFDVETKYPFMPKSVARRLVRAYGTDSWRILQKIASVNDLGTDFGAGVFAAELDWVVENEWVSSAEDFVWRRTRLGLRLSVEQIAVIDDYIRQRHSI